MEKVRWCHHRYGSEGAKLTFVALGGTTNFKTGSRNFAITEVRQGIVFK
jgi:hypothetical protein